MFKQCTVSKHAHTPHGVYEVPRVGQDTTYHALVVQEEREGGYGCRMRMLRVRETVHSTCGRTSSYTSNQYTYRVPTTSAQKKNETPKYPTSVVLLNTTFRVKTTKQRKRDVASDSSNSFGVDASTQMSGAKSV